MLCDSNRQDDLKSNRIYKLPSPKEILDEFSISPKQTQFISNLRKQVTDILFGKDPRILIVIGPCSIHDTQGALDYAHRLKSLSWKVQDKMLLVMRNYFEKPRTSIGWPGLILDPHLDATRDIQVGIRRARKFLSEITDLEIPVATEFLDPITPMYMTDFVCWTAIGARTSESQTHRQIASGLGIPVGFKNSTDGLTYAAINGIEAAKQPQSYLGIDNDGHVAAINTPGNPNSHIILRGGGSGPNYHREFIQATAATLRARKLPDTIMVDCSHGNCERDPLKQLDVFLSSVKNISDFDLPVRGIMLESNIHTGKQDFPESLRSLEYGKSITDPCLGWEETESLILHAHEILSQ